MSRVDLGDEARLRVLDRHLEHPAPGAGGLHALQLAQRRRRRGIATGRRLTARTIAQQYADKVREYIQPYQFALSTRAGVDCVVLLCRVLTEQDEDSGVSSLDGIDAYDHVHRSAVFVELRADPELGRMRPFVRL